MDAGGDRLHSSNTCVIKEIYDSEYSRETFEIELDKALDAGCSVIVIEPTQLGEETSRWISVGNCLHKTAVISGIGAITAGLLCHENPFICAPLGAVSLLCTGLYTASWQFDNCVKYQVERDPRKLSRLPIYQMMSATSPVVLVRKDDTRRKILHCAVSLTAAALCSYRLVKNFK